MRKLNHNHALVLFSGGQDSSIALIWALDRFDKVETIGFEYGQRHAVELEARQNVRRAVAGQFADWAPKLGEDFIVGAHGLKDVGDTAMTSDQAFETGADDLPNTFVPGRNLVFLNLAAALAYRRGAGVLIGGMCETDFSGYPDCREEALAAQMRAVQLGMDCDITLETPLMHETKAASWRLVEKVGGARAVELVNELSHTCYSGDRSLRHEWGYGCGKCPACELRKAGWLAYRAGE